MTEIQWILNIVINHKLDDEVKKLCLERIGEVESKITHASTTFVSHAPINHQPFVAPVMPAKGLYPVSEAQLRDQAVVNPIQTLPNINQPAEVVTGQGNGTSIRGPNKFKRHQAP